MSKMCLSEVNGACARGRGALKGFERVIRVLSGIKRVKDIGAYSAPSC